MKLKKQKIKKNKINKIKKLSKKKLIKESHPILKTTIFSFWQNNWMLKFHKKFTFLCLSTNSLTLKNPRTPLGDLDKPRKESLIGLTLNFLKLPRTIHFYQKSKTLLHYIDKSSKQKKPILMLKSLILKMSKIYLIFKIPQKIILSRFSRN